MNKIRVGFFSFADALGDHGDYNAWHQLDHMPEMLSITGLSWGQRWVATPACKRSRVVVTPRMEDGDYLVLYLMEDPVVQVLRHFEEMGELVQGLGRLRLPPHTRLRAPFRLTEARVAPRALIRAEAVPYRPNRGVYVIVEEYDDDVDQEQLAAVIRERHQKDGALLDIPGVVGMWEFATSSRLTTPAGMEGNYRATVVYLDGDPIAVAAHMGKSLRGRWDGGPLRPLLAGPFQAFRPWHWDPYHDPNTEAAPIG